MKKVLICGATGFIGKNILLNFAKNKKYEIHAVNFKRKPFKTDRKVYWHKADLRNYKSVDRLVKNMDIVIQAAATTSGSKDIVSAPHIHVTDNAVMNSYIFRAANECSVKHLLFTSCTVMYPSSNSATKESNFNGKIIDKYKGVGETKVYIEKLAEFFSMIGRTKFTIIRHSNIYGPHDKYDLEKSHVFGATITKVMHAKKEIEVWGEGKEKRDFLYIDDLIRFINLAIQRQKKSYEIFNCGSGKPVTIRKLCELIVESSGKKIELKFNKAKPTIPFNLFLNCSKAKRILAWEPKIDITVGIKKSIKWWKENVGEKI